MPFFGTVTERAFRKKIPKHGNKNKMMQRYALDFYSINTLDDRPAFWIFFQDSRIRVNTGLSVCKNRKKSRSNQNLSFSSKLVSSFGTEFSGDSEGQDRTPDRTLNSRPGSGSSFGMRTRLDRNPGTNLDRNWSLTTGDIPSLLKTSNQNRVTSQLV